MHDLLSRPARTGFSPLPPTGSVDPRRPALVDVDGSVVDHGTLRARVDDLAAALPDSLAGRLLAHVRLRPTVEDIVAWFAVLEAGHVGIITDTWPADLSLAGGRIEHLTDAPRHLLHPDLAVLLSTSGSTNSPKLVRLSHDNITSNARGIATALDLGPDDRGITSLPLHYTFGLSVLHSHLTVGAAVTLSEASVLDEGFWRQVDEGVTTLAVVPHMVELVETTGVLHRPHPSLRLVTQAGGRLAPDRVTRTADLGRRHGWGLSVMYGQTEATARISVQPPDLAAASPATVGRPLPGTTITIDTSVPGADPRTGSGEVVVRGPGVMMGYAEHPDELALGPMLGELRTGDLGVLRDGLLQVTGRRSGFVKVLGLRIDLARVEAALEADDLVCCVTGDDTGLRVAVEPVPDEPAEQTATRARRLAAHASSLGVAQVRVAVVALARLANGKVDRAGCDALVRSSEATRPETTQSTATRVATVLGDLLGGDGIDLTQSFVSQGGDSLSHVQAGAVLTDLLGDLPADWHHRRLDDLVRAAAPAGAGPQPGARRTRPVETSVVLRALAVVMIAGSHAHLFRLPGGAHALLAVAGYSAGMFGLSLATTRLRWRSTGRLLLGIAIPTMAVAAFGMVTGRYGIANLLLANWATGDVNRLQRNELWFVDALVLCLLVTTALLSVPALRRGWQSHPWQVAFGLLLVGLVARFTILGLFEGTLRGIMPTVFFLFAAGLALSRATTVNQRLLTLAAAAVGVVDFFPGDALRNGLILAGITALALLARVPVPTRLVTPVTVLAAASLHIYLVQFHILDWLGRPLLGTCVSLAAGVLLWRLTARPTQRLQQLLLPATPQEGPRP
ncbi:AMP-binding protein [Propionibacteriaceae bacterium Y1923]